MSYEIGKPVEYTDELDNAIVCPGCGEFYLNHGRVEVFDRTEDASIGLHVTVSDGVHIDTKMDGNPSARRHGLRIVFRCEHCPARPSLTLIQHKGCTFLQWEASKRLTRRR